MTEVDPKRHFAQLFHELHMPLIAIKGATELAEAEMRWQGRVLSKDFLGDIEMWATLMSRLISNAEYAILGIPDRSLNVRRERVMLLSNVIMPAISQVRILLMERRFPRESIDVSGFEQVPPLYIDRELFQQVVFNILTNSIKYAYHDPSAFRIDVHATPEDDCWRVAFRDWGIGIAKEDEPNIFQEGFRGSGSRQYAAGQGLGLWIAKRIAQDHGVDLTVTTFRLPTEFVLTIPKSLAHPPREQ